MDTRVSTGTRLSVLPIFIALILNLFIGPLAPLIDQGLSDVLAAPETVADQDGPNDEPGQKDLTSLTIDYADLPTSVDVSWNWDEISWSGANTGDACALFDTNDNLNVDAAVCVTVSGDPATLLDVRLYECTADQKVDRCTGPAEVASPALTDCTVSQTNTDPFPAGDENPVDTTATCTIFLAEVAATAAELVNVCSFPSEEPNSDPSDCVLIIRDGALRVTKVVINDNGGALKCEAFSFTINPGAISETFEADPDCSNLVAVEPGTYSVTEPAVSGYTTTYSNCTDVDVDSGETETCTITNNDQGASLTVTKIVINDNGGTAVVADFPLFIDGNSVTSGAANSVNAGSHTVSETAQPGYTGAIAGDCASDGSVTLALGQSKTCTITNDDDAPSLTLIKQVTNDNGGGAAATAWTLTATGTGGSPTNLSGSTPVTSGSTFKADTYTLAESGPADYTASSWDCGSATMPTATTVTVGLGDDVTCTIVNDDDEPSLTLIKQVTNDNGGDAAATEWTLSATGTGGSPTNLSGTTPVSSGSGFEADTYTLAESGGPSGYTAGAWDCGNATMPTATTVTVGLGDDVTCTIINDDQAGTLIVEKVVVGGALDCDDFSFTVNGGGLTPFATDCSNELTVDAGDYSVFEPLVTGWTTTYENSLNDDLDCTSLSIGNGGSATCTITNTRQTGNLEVVKDLNPAADPGRFNLQIGGTTDPDAANIGDGGSTGQQTLDTGTYAVGETAGTGTSLGNYASTIVCRADNGTGAIVVQGSGAGPLNVDVTNGSDIVCVISNTRVTVAIDKANDEGDNASVEPGETIHFTLTVTVNNGPATGVVITDQLPTGLGNATNISDGGTYSAATNRITWNVGNLAQGVHTFEYDATVAANASGTLTNLGCVDADQNDALVCDQTSLLVQNIVITKTNASASTVVPGTAVDFTLALDVTNGPIDSVTIVDQLPTGIANATNISDGGTYSAATNRITWNLVNVADNETLTYRATVSATAAAGTLTNVATITDGPCVGDGCDDDSTVTVRVPTLVVDKVASTETITISGPNDALVATPSVVTWTVSFTLTNGPVTNAVITDVIPTGFSYVAGSASNSGVFNAATNTVTWTFATLSTSGSVTFQTTVNPATISRTGPTLNTATIDSNETAPDTGQDSVTVAVIPPPLAGTPPTPPAPVLPNTATGIGLDGKPITVPIELLVAFFIGSLGALALANVNARSRRR